MRDPRGYMRTFTGQKFWPLDPRVEDVVLEDIAQSLSEKCRYGGHASLHGLPLHYSVAEHEVRMAKKIWEDTHDKIAAYQALHHDDAEYVFPDIISPIKHAPDKAWEKFFKPYERAVEKVVFKALSVPTPFNPLVKITDKRILTSEMMIFGFPEEDYKNPDGAWKYGDGPLVDYDFDDIGWDRLKARDEWMTLHFELIPWRPGIDIGGV